MPIRYRYCYTCHRFTKHEFLFLDDVFVCLDCGVVSENPVIRDRRYDEYPECPRQRCGPFQNIFMEN